MSATDAPIYVVLVADAYPKELRTDGHIAQPMVMETTAEHWTLDAAQKRAAFMEPRWGACRIGRVVFEDAEGRPL